MGLTEVSQWASVGIMAAGAVTLLVSAFSLWRLGRRQRPVMMILSAGAMVLLGLRFGGAALGHGEDNLVEGEVARAALDWVVFALVWNARQAVVGQVRQSQQVVATRRKVQP